MEAIDNTQRTAAERTITALDSMLSHYSGENAVSKETALADAFELRTMLTSVIAEDSLAVQRVRENLRGSMDLTRAVAAQFHGNNELRDALTELVQSGLVFTRNDQQRQTTTELSPAQQPGNWTAKTARGGGAIPTGEGTDIAALG